MKPPDSTTIHFRELNLSDVSVFHNGAFGTPEVTEYLQWETHTETAETEVLVEEMIDLHQREAKYFWVATSPDDKRIVGLGSIKPEKETAWVGFLVILKEHRKGYGLAILSALESAVLENFERVSAAVNSKNHSSVKLLKKRDWKEWDCESVSPLKAYEKLKANKAVVDNSVRASLHATL
jgi:RimJ/RimL family protein N-acetyltransferase